MVDNTDDDDEKTVTIVNALVSMLRLHLHGDRRIASCIACWYVS